jgi:hypothetical protein
MEMLKKHLGRVEEERNSLDKRCKLVMEGRAEINQMLQDKEKELE